MKSWRRVVSVPHEGADHMALDEVLFLAQEKSAAPITTLRLYEWEKPCITIGYFQKHREFCDTDLPVIRRLTGGLAVHHFKDIAYCFITNTHDCPFIYDQQKMYQLVHTAILKGLQASGIQAQFNDGIRLNPNAQLCAHSHFDHDLYRDGKKVVGSCQRRRGKNLLQQGSITIDGAGTFEIVTAAIEEGFAAVFSVAFQRDPVTETEYASMQTLKIEKYAQEKWNKKY